MKNHVLGKCLSIRTVFYRAGGRLRGSLTPGFLVSSLTTLLLARPVLATQPCPPGTDPWTTWVTIGFLLYVLLALAGVGVSARAAIRARSMRKKLLSFAATLLVAVLAVVGGLGLVMYISWTFPCV